MRAVEDDKKQDDVPDPRATKGIRIATRCVTIEQFVASYHQICEDSAIFIPNTQRPIKTVMQFRFDLQDGNPALLGVGTVVDELTTKHNRFDHAGIVVELQRLSRASEITFDQMLAARARTTKLAVPTPVYPRAMTVPIEVIRAPKSERMTTAHQPLRLPIPPAIAVPSSTTLSSTPKPKSVIGLPTLAKKRTHTVTIPVLTAPTQKPSVAIPTERLTPERPPLKPRCVPSSIDDGWDSEPEPALGDAQPVVAAVLAVATATTTASIVEGSIDVDVDVDIDLDLASAPADQERTVLLKNHASVGTPTVTAVDSRVACAADPDPFDTVTTIQSPDELLLALVRRDDGRASPGIIEAAAGPAPRATLAISEPMQPIVEDRLPPAVMERMFAPPTIAPATFPSIHAPFPAMPAIDHAALAGVPVGAARRSWRWVAGAFAALLCAIVVTSAFVDRPVTSVPQSTIAPAHESPLDSPAVATARDQAPPVAAAPQTPAIAPSAVVKINSRARPRSIERPSPRPQPAARPLRRPAPKKCRQLRCL